MSVGLNGNKTLAVLLISVNVMLAGSGIAWLNARLDRIERHQEELSKENEIFRDWARAEIALKPYRSEIPQLVVPAPETRRRLRRIERHLGLYEGDD